MALNRTDKVQGVGVYAEFRSEKETLQLLVTPDALTTTGVLVPMSLHRRLVTPSTPKKQWKITSLKGKEMDAYLASDGTVTTPLPITEIGNVSADRFRFAFSILDEIIAKGWTVVNKPILVEVSQHDADDIARNKTPNKILYRVNISKKSLGYPAEII